MQLQGGHTGQGAGQGEGGETQGAQGDAACLLQVANQGSAGKPGNSSVYIDMTADALIQSNWVRLRTEAKGASKLGVQLYTC